jgi:hypothetical protein
LGSSATPLLSHPETPLTKTAQPGISRKMVVIKQIDGRALPGYLIPSGLTQADSVDLLTPEGEHQSIGMSSIQRIYFVRNFSEPTDTGRKAFLSRPKLPGLWVRLIFRDGDMLEGILTNDLLDVLDNGLQITPPDLSGNCHRIFVPRLALAGFTILGVMGAARPRRMVPRTAQFPQKIQHTLFEEPEP